MTVTHTRNLLESYEYILFSFKTRPVTYTNCFRRSGTSSFAGADPEDLHVKEVDDDKEQLTCGKKLAAFFNAPKVTFYYNTVRMPVIQRLLRKTKIILNQEDEM